MLFTVLISDCLADCHYPRSGPYNTLLKCQVETRLGGDKSSGADRYHISHRRINRATPSLLLWPGYLSLLLVKMSYRYPHEDDSDENGFGESLQQSLGAQPHDSSDSDDDVFEPATEVTEDDQDDDENDSDYEDEDDEDEDEDDDDAFHGQWWLLNLFVNSLG